MEKESLERYQDVDISQVIDSLNNLKDSATRDTYIHLLKAEIPERRKLINDKMKYEYAERRLGQIFTFSIVILGFIFSAIFIFFANAPEAAITALVTSVFPCAMAGIRNFNK